MSLTLGRLPNELLDIIITNVLPEGFESVAVTCKKIYAACTPFILRHNTLRWRFHHFHYYEMPVETFPTVGTAFELITLIAVEPLVARYVRDADFSSDSHFLRGRPCGWTSAVRSGNAVVNLFANSPYLKQAGLDWQEYYAEIEKDFRAARYSQHAAAFLLTLLPNIQELGLPNGWKSLGATDKLIEAVIRQARQSHLPYDGPSLAKVTDFGLSVSLGPQERWDLDWPIPFLALPCIRSFRGPSCVALDGSGHTSMPSKSPFGGFANTLQSVHLVSCDIDAVGIADFLKQSTHLRTLRYSHTTKGNGGPRDWNICGFLAAIEREVGNHLEGLSVSVRELRGSIAPGSASMRGFQQLRKLELPLEIVMCTITTPTANENAPIFSDYPVVGDSSSADHDGLGENESFISNLVPRSISQLSLLSGGSKHHAKALDIMFQNFAANKACTLPALEEIFLTCTASADDAYKEQCEKLLAETEKVDVVLHLMPWLHLETIAWGEK